MIIGDEPVSALDVSVQAQVINLLEDLKPEFDLTLVLIAHDLAVIRHMSDRVAVMYLGEVVELAGTDALFERPLHPYAQALMQAIPIPSPHGRTMKATLSGDAPSPLAPPSGCRFHPRCPHADARCAAEKPVMDAAEGGRQVACHHWRRIAAELPPLADAPRKSPSTEARFALYRDRSHTKPGGSRTGPRPADQPQEL